MARRPDTNVSKSLTAAQLVELRHKLAGLSINELEIEYKVSHDMCRYVGRRIPAKFIQELVQAWRELERRG